MKIVSTAFLMLALMLQMSQVFGKTNETFKPGDWFECEMEFADRLPIFHNHWANNDSLKSVQEYLALRFTYQEKSADNLDVWQYKIVRYRILSPMMSRNDKENRRDNLLCFDSWYPDYFKENIDSIRKNLIGEVSLENGKIIKHTYEYGAYRASKRKMSVSKIKSNTVPIQWIVNSDKFSASSVFPLNVGSFYVSSTVSGLTDDLHTSIERFIYLIFTTHLLEGNQEALNDFFKLNQLELASDNTLSFSIESKESSKGYNDLTAYLLPNGLSYAFKDRYNQKVMAITNASFDLPNKAYLRIIDLRSFIVASIAKDLGVDDWFTNPAYVISEFKEVNNDTIVFQYQLKEGVEFSIGSEYHLFKPKRLFVQPSDSIEVIIGGDGNNDSITIKGTRNFKDIESSNQYVVQSDYSPEYKAYIELQQKIDIAYHSLSDEFDFKKYQKNLVCFTYLKSYYYKSLYELRNAGTFYSIGNIGRIKQMNAAGAPSRVGFQQRYYSALGDFSHFSLYAELFSVLESAINLRYEAYYEDFLQICEDTLMINALSTRIRYIKSIQPGNFLPFPELGTGEDSINILPKKGKYGLLLLYSYESRDVAYRSRLFKYNPDKVQVVTYNIGYGNKYIEKRKLQPLAIADSLDLIGRNSMSPDIEQYLTGRLSNSVILYDDKGKILYNSEIHLYTDESFEKCFDAFDAAIEQAENTPKQDYESILIGILIAVVLSVGLSFGIGRFRIKQLKRKNEREQLIQELKLKSVQSQLNPHFLFNALNSIQVLVNSGDAKQADTYLVGFSELLRNVLKNADRRLVSLTHELQIVKRYCELEKLRTDFDFSIETNTQTPVDLIEIPYMLLQPVVENAIKHGVLKATEKGQLFINISEIGASVQIEVSDNGPGFAGVPLETLAKKGRGIQLSLEKLQSIYGNDAELLLLEATPGTRVLIKLKIG